MAYDDVFSISPNPNLMVTTPGIRGVLFKIRYCIRAKQGLSVIVGDVGMGKSTLLRAIHSELSARPDIVTTLLPTAKFPTSLAFLKRICDDLGIARRKASIDQQAEFSSFLIEQEKAGKTVVVMVDEAQLMDGDQLELIRTLLNNETHTHKLIQFILAGQLSIVARLKSPRMKALKSRIVAPCSVNPLNLDEAREMIRLRCEAWAVPNPFPAPILERMYQLTDGVPRLLLRLCGLVSALAESTGASVSMGMVEQVAADMQFPEDEDESAHDREEAAETTTATV